MYQEAIEILDGFMNEFPAISKMEIVSKTHIELHLDEGSTNNIVFESAQDMSEWCEAEFK